MSDLKMMLDAAAADFSPDEARIEEILSGVLADASPRAVPRLDLVRARRRRRGMTLGMLAAALLTSGALAKAGISWYEQTKNLKGDDLKTALSLSPVAPAETPDIRSDDAGLFQGARLLSNCPPKNAMGKYVAMVQVDGELYCVAGDTKYQAWELAQRLRGHDITPEEAMEMQQELPDDAASPQPTDSP